MIFGAHQFIKPLLLLLQHQTINSSNHIWCNNATAGGRSYKSPDCACSRRPSRCGPPRTLSVGSISARAVHLGDTGAEVARRKNLLLTAWRRSTVASHYTPSEEKRRVPFLGTSSGFSPRRLSLAHVTFPTSFHDPSGAGTFIGAKIQSHPQRDLPISSLARPQNP